MASTIDLTTYPTSRSDATEDLSSDLFSSVIGKGVIAGVGDEFEVFADSTGHHVKVRTGRGHSGGFWGNSDDEEVIDLDTAHPTADRIDAIVLRLDRTSPATLRLRRVTGVPDIDPDPPDLEDEDIYLADVLVDNGVSTITPGKVTDRRVFAQPGSSPNDRTEFKGDVSAPGYTSSDGTLRALVGLRSDVSGNNTDLVNYTYGGAIRFFISGPGEVLRVDSSRQCFINRELRVGDSPVNGSVPYTRIGNFGDTISSYVAVDGADADYALVLRSKGTGSIQFQAADGETSAYFTIPEGLVSGDTTFVIGRQLGSNFTLQPVTQGALDSGGAGFRALVVPN